MTLLELVRQVMAELALQQVSGVVGNQEPSVRQIFALMNRLCTDLTREYDWQRLMREHILTTQANEKEAALTENSAVVTVASTAGLSAKWGIWGTGARPFAQILSIDSPTTLTMNMPADKTGTFDLRFSQIEYPLPAAWKKQIPQTEWDRTNRWPLMGPQTPQAWQSFKSGIVYAGPRERFRIMGNCIAVNPPPPAGLLFSFEYVSKNFAVGADGAYKPSFTLDTDTCIYDDSLVVLGTKTLFLQAKGLDFSLEGQQFTNLLAQCKAQDASAPALSISPRRGSIFLSNANLPDGNWGRPQW